MCASSSVTGAGQQTGVTDNATIQSAHLCSLRWGTGREGAVCVSLCVHRYDHSVRLSEDKSCVLQ